MPTLKPLLLLSLLLFTAPASPSATQPAIPLDPFCLRPRNLLVGKCICWVLFATKVKVFKQKVSKDICLGVFGSVKAIKKAKKICNRFRRNGKLNLKRLVKVVSGYVSRCAPGLPELKLTD